MSLHISREVSIGTTSYPIPRLPYISLAKQSPWRVIHPATVYKHGKCTAIFTAMFAE
jgi:hypothetical protein